MWVIMIYMFVLLIIAQKKNKAAAKTTTTITTATVTVQVRQAEVSQWEFSCHYVFPDEIVKRITRSTNIFGK